MKGIKYFVVLIIIALSVNSCKKTEGEGGTSSINGKIKIKEYNKDFTVLKNEYYAQDEDVFIVYGDEAKVGDKIETLYDGTYKFDYLRKGNYTIYAYSEDSTGESVSGKIPVEKDVKILSKGENLEVEDITIYITTKNKSGNSTITGKVYVIDVNAVGIETGNNYYAYDEDVFLVYENENYYIDDVKTNYNGTYMFKNLPTGTYKIYAYTEVYNNMGVQQLDTTVVTQVTITSNLETVSAPEIQIRK